MSALLATLSILILTKIPPDVTRPATDEIDVRMKDDSDGEIDLMDDYDFLMAEEKQAEAQRRGDERRNQGATYSSRERRVHDPFNNVLPVRSENEPRGFTLQSSIWAPVGFVDPPTPSPALKNQPIMTYGQPDTPAPPASPTATTNLPTTAPVANPTGLAKKVYTLKDSRLAH